MAARTIPFPLPSGTAATGRQNLITPPPGVAKVSEPSRRYRGLYIVPGHTPVHTKAAPLPPGRNSLKQAQAIVTQVSREIEQQAARRARPMLVSHLPHPEAGPSSTGRLFRSILRPLQ